MLEHLCPYGGVASCLGVACVLCAVQNESIRYGELMNKMMERRVCFVL
jgi:hypothetical protein